ncbi:MAG: phytanoyl-CoA dioxygenase family protein [Holosporales bacterium]
MLSSMDSLVVWVPLVDVGKNNGSIIIWPKSHLKGPLPFVANGGFASVQTEGDGLQTELEIGDIVIFSTLLVHSSGEILDSYQDCAHSIACAFPTHPSQGAL